MIAKDIFDRTGIIVREIYNKPEYGEGFTNFVLWYPDKNEFGLMPESGVRPA